MPANVVKTPADERHWKMAKELAAKQGHVKDWKYIMGIFRRMKTKESACLEYGTSVGVRKAWDSRRRGMNARVRQGKPVYTPKQAHSILGPYGARKTKGQKRIMILDAVRTPVKGLLKSDRQLHDILSKHGLIGKVQMGLHKGLRTENGVPVKYTLMSNDRSRLYLGAHAGMRNWLMKQHAMLGMHLPKGFENWDHKQIEDAFMKMKNSKIIERRISRWTKPVKR